MACAVLIHFTYRALRLEVGTGRDECIHHRRVPSDTGVVKRCLAIFILSVGGARGAGVGFSEEGREGGDGW